MATLSTHILDTSIGLPAPNVRVVCEHATGTQWRMLAEGITDSDGRVKGLEGGGTLITDQRYRLIFYTAPYFEARQVSTFYPKVCVEFVVGGDRDHYHVPLLLNPFGFSTYRGS